MNKSAATRISNKANNMNNSYSIGYRRLHHTPTKIIVSLGTAFFLDGVGLDCVSQKSTALLESMTEIEFKNWLMVM